MLKEKFKEKNKQDVNNKKKIENILFLVVVLIVTIIIINVILKSDSESVEDIEKETDTYKTLASSVSDEENNTNYNDLERKLENILATIKGAGDVQVFINYSESNKIVAMYDETTTTSSTEETDSSGGTRDTTSTETQREVVYSDENGNKTPITEKVIMPTIEGAIITATGASNTTVKSNIISAVKSATGLSIDKIQVFEME